MKNKSAFVPVENLRTINRTLAAAHEMKLYDLSLLGEKLSETFFEYHGEFDVLTCISLLRENTDFHFSRLPDFSLPENQNRLLQMEKADAVYDYSALSESFLAALEKKRCLLSEGDFFPPQKAEKKIAFVKNALSEEAFEVFSEEYGGFSSCPTLSWKDASKAVAEGVVGYCLLPFEEAGDGRFPSTLELLDAYELKIVAVTPVYGFDGGANMKYALLCDSLTVFPYSSEDDRYLEIHIPSTEDFLGICRVGSYFEYACDRIQTVKRQEDFYRSVVFKSEGKSFLPLLVTISLFFPDVSFVGLYKNLET